MADQEGRDDKDWYAPGHMEMQDRPDLPQGVGGICDTHDIQAPRQWQRHHIRHQEDKPHRITLDVLGHGPGVGCLQPGNTGLQPPVTGVQRRGRICMDGLDPRFQIRDNPVEAIFSPGGDIDHRRLLPAGVEITMPNVAIASGRWTFATVGDRAI
ncbi:MAG: hypothetical protein AAF317_18875 [Pseudomonadota bacterium]